MKKQFRLYDVYRYAAVGEMSQIRGIKSYEVNKDATVITITLYNGREYTDILMTENERKAFITRINKILGNCRKPGRKS